MTTTMTRIFKQAKITPISAFSDNYIWVIQNSADRCTVVDPGDATPVISWLQANNVQLSTILITHHHMDHIGGVEQLLSQTGAQVFGPEDTRLPKSWLPVSEADEIDIDGLVFNVIEVPGHTRSHIAFYSPEANSLFCGDALFSMGCGRMFEGTAQQMLGSLDKLAALPNSTAVYCTHEYTAANGRFALAIEPENKPLQQRCQQVAGLRKLNQATLPVALGTEKQTNPFLRCRQPQVIAAAKNIEPSVQNPTDVFAAIRRWKDNF